VQTVEKRTGRNEMLECLRMVAMFFVVCIHFPFPGKFGATVSALARFAVPMFFAISGYFSFHARADKIAKRFWHLVKLNGLAILICLFRVMAQAVYNGGSVWESWRTIIPSVGTLGRWFFLHVNPFGGQFWYLTAVAFCYAILWVYVSFFGKDHIDYRPLYIVGTALLAIEFVIADVVRLYIENIPVYCFRNGWFLGLPMFCMGLFLHEHQQRIFENFRLNTRKILFIFLGATFLLIIQWQGYGDRELPLGAILQSAMLLLLVQKYPVLSKNSAWLKQVISTFGFLSFSVFMLHMDYTYLYHIYFSPFVRKIIGVQLEEWLTPVIIYAATLAMGIVALLVVRSGKRIKNKRLSKNS